MSKAFSFLGLAAILVVFVIAAGCLNPTPAQPNPGEPGGMCGGIAGIECEEDFVCQYGGNNPDAAGTCVKAEEERLTAEHAAAQLLVDWDDAIKENDLFDRQKEIDKNNLIFSSLNPLFP